MAYGSAQARIMISGPCLEDEVEALRQERVHLDPLGEGQLAQGPRHARERAGLIEACDETIPFEVCEALAPLVVQLRNLDEATA
jgi:hypothetical protein